MGIAQLDEVRSHRIDTPGVECTWTNLGKAIESVSVGLRRIEIPAGKRPTPPHDHHAEEEIFFVLGGHGLSWQSGTTCEVRAGDCIVHVAGSGAHTLRAGADGLDVLVFGQRKPAELCVLPRTGHGWLGQSWVAAGEGASPWQRDAELGEPAFPPPSARPPSVVNVADVAPLVWARTTVASDRRDLGRAAGSVETGLRHLVIPSGMLAAPPHCHSAEEEIFVVLEGSGTLLLGADETPVRAGTVVGRPAGTRVAHAFRAGADGLTLLAYGTRDPSDATFYPRSNKIFLRGLGVIARVENLDYWDGED